uniref:Fibrinogen C-terminal domain-containing protein n=1 Tax=Anopheles albimanus TaxID=7167 RepID=A0A182F5C1_ANOAL
MEQKAEAEVSEVQTMPAINGKSSSNAVHCNKPGVASEIILSKVESVLQQLHTLQQDVQEQRKSIKENQDQVKYTLEVLAKMQQEMQQRHTEYQAVITDIRDALSDDRQHNRQKLNDLQPELSKQREEVKSNQIANEKRMEQLQRDIKDMRAQLLINPGSYRSCKDVQSKASGLYNIRGKDILDSFVAYCEQDKHGGGWMVIQHRFNGSLSFNRDWSAYRDGFGHVGGEHWLGLERVSQFTKEQQCELLVELKDFNNTYKYARYNAFGAGFTAVKTIL